MKARGVLLTYSVFFTETPCKMTPGKQHIELVPETPAGKSTRRKSDGTLMVKESPNIDKLKKDINYKPLSASFLTKSTSFYSGMSFFINQIFTD